MALYFPANFFRIHHHDLMLRPRGNIYRNKNHPNIN